MHSNLHIQIYNGKKNASILPDQCETQLLRKERAAMSRRLTQVTTALSSGRLLVLAHSDSLPDQRGPNIGHGTMPPAQDAQGPEGHSKVHWFYHVTVTTRNDPHGVVQRRANYQVACQDSQLHSDSFRFKACGHKKIHLPIWHERHETHET